MASEPGEPVLPPAGAVHVPVVQEELYIDKRVTDTGHGVRVDKRVHEHPQQVSERLWQDEIEVQRIPVGVVVAAGDAPSPRYEGDTLVVPVLEEVLVLEKRCRIKEELRITRTRRETRHTETVALRTEEVTVQRFDEGTAES